MKTTESTALLSILTNQHDDDQNQLEASVRQMFAEIDELSLLPLQDVVPRIKNKRVAQVFIKSIIDWIYNGGDMDEEEVEEFDALYIDMMPDVLSVPGVQEWVHTRVVDWGPLKRGDPEYRELVSRYLIGTWGIGGLMDEAFPEGVTDEALSMASKTLDAWDSFVNFVVHGVPPGEVDLRNFTFQGFDMSTLSKIEVKDAFPVDWEFVDALKVAVQDPDKAPILLDVFYPFLLNQKPRPDADSFMEEYPWRFDAYLTLCKAENDDAIDCLGPMIINAPPRLKDGSWMEGLSETVVVMCKGRCGM